MSRNALLTVAHGDRVPGMSIWSQAGPQWALLLYVLQGSSDKQTELGQSSKSHGSFTQAQAYVPSSFRHWSPSYNLSLSGKSCVTQCDQAGLDATDTLSSFPTSMTTFDCPFSQPHHQKHPWACLAVLLSPSRVGCCPPLPSFLPA